MGRKLTCDLHNASKRKLCCIAVATKLRKNCSDILSLALVVNDHYKMDTATATR